MQRPKRVIYVGTYERDYPRNEIVIAALRRAGCDVCELHEAIWTETSDKSAAIRSPRALLGIGRRLAGAYARLLLRLVKNRNRADLVAFGYIGQVDVLALAPFARLLRKPILFNPLVTLTDTLVDDRRRVANRGLAARLIRLVDQMSLKLADSILVDTRSNKDFLVSDFNVRPEKIQVVPVGADESLFRPSGTPIVERDDPGCVCRALRVLFYGNMIPLQGVETIIRAAELLEHECDTHIDVIGTGQAYASVRGLADQLGVRNVTFVPRVPYDDLPAWIDAADVVLGIFGGSDKAARVVPNKVYQAMAMGSAIVTRDSPASRDLLTDGESAMLVPPENAVALAHAIQQLVDPSLRRRLCNGARARFLEVAALDIQAAQVHGAVARALARSPALWPKATT